MPELPEVQTIVNDLQVLAGDKITGFWTRFAKAIKTKGFEKEIIGKKILAVRRIGKNVVIDLAGGKAIVMHLKMTGKLLVTSHQSSVIGHQKEKHLHHIFYLKKNGVLEFHDIRKFATLEIADEKKLAKMIEERGVDPLSREFTAKKLSEILEKRKGKSVKSVLMDQAAISGIGNIYASEIPFDAKISPLRKAGSLDKDEISSLCRSTLKILRKAVRLRGTSFSDYRDASGKKGSFQNHLKAYGKAGEKCSACGMIIEKAIVGQRSTFYCPRCQK